MYQRLLAGIFKTGQGEALSNLLIRLFKPCVAATVNPEYMGVSIVPPKSVAILDGNLRLPVQKIP